MKRYWFTYLLIGKGLPLNHYGKVILDAYALTTGLMKRSIEDIKKTDSRITDVILINWLELIIDDEPQ